MDEFVKRVAKCDECIHNSVCYMQEVCNDIEEWLREFGCDHYRRTADVVEVVRCKDCVSSEMYEFGCSGVKRLACVEKEDGVVRFAQAVDPMGYCSYGKRKDGAE